jgi:hypothetical protein
MKILRIKFNLPFAVPGNAKLKLPCIYNEKLSAIKASVSQPFVNVFIWNKHDSFPCLFFCKFPKEQLTGVWIQIVKTHVINLVHSLKLINLSARGWGICFVFHPKGGALFLYFGPTPGYLHEKNKIYQCPGIVPGGGDGRSWNWLMHYKVIINPVYTIKVSVITGGVLNG